MPVVSVENVNSVERRLTIAVPAEIVEAAYAKHLNQFAQQANIKGFRPGKAPMSYIKQRFDDDARKDALGEVIQKAFYEAITEQKLNPVSQPQIEPKMTAPDQAFEFVASFEVLPEIGTVNFSLDNVDKLNVEVTNDDATRVIEQLRKQYTKWNLVDRAAKDHDRVVLDFYGVFEGNADMENQVKNYPIELGSGVMLPGFESGLVGSKAGEEKTLQLTFPEDFPVGDKAGKPVEYVISVKQVFEAEMPAIDEAFVKRLGIKSGNEEELRTQIKQSLEQEKDRLVSEKLKDQVFRRLLDLNPLEVPKSLIAREAKNIHDEMHPNHGDHEHHHGEEENAMFNELAKKRILLSILISEFGKQANIEPDKGKVTQRIQEIAAAYENPQEVMQWLSSEERLSGIAAQVMEDQVVDKLLEGVNVTTKTITYAELKGIRI